MRLGRNLSHETGWFELAGIQSLEWGKVLVQSSLVIQEKEKIWLARWKTLNTMIKLCMPRVKQSSFPHPRSVDQHLPYLQGVQHWDWQCSWVSTAMDLKRNGEAAAHGPGGAWTFVSHSQHLSVSFHKVILRTPVCPKDVWKASYGGKNGDCAVLCCHNL